MPSMNEISAAATEMASRLDEQMKSLDQAAEDTMMTGATSSRPTIYILAADFIDDGGLMR